MGTSGPMWASGLGPLRGCLCRRAAGAEPVRYGECPVQGQETAPRESCPEDREKSIHLRWGTKGTTWHRMSSCEEGVHLEEQPREEAELWTESSSRQRRSVVAEGGCLSGCVGESRTRKCNRTSARSKGCAGRCGVTAQED